AIQQKRWVESLLRRFDHDWRLLTMRSGTRVVRFGRDFDSVLANLGPARAFTDHRNQRHAQEQHGTPEGGSKLGLARAKKVVRGAEGPGDPFHTVPTVPECAVRTLRALNDVMVR